MTTLTQTITGSDYLAFLTAPAFWPQADQANVHAEGVELEVDGKRYWQADIIPHDIIKPDSRVTILAGDVFEFMTPMHSLQAHYESWTENCATLRTLKAKHDDFNAGLRARGVELLSYVMPCCGVTVESQPAPEGATWDTLATCYGCGTLYMKISTSTAITALVMGADGKVKESAQ